MNKKLLSLAVATAMAAPLVAPTAAQADVTIYGRMHMSIDWFQADTLPGEPGLNDIQVSSNSSRIGFKGSEDIGGGQKVIWQVETGVNVEEYSNGSGWASRNSFLGLSGGWGTFIAGKHDTPMKIVGRKLDPFGDTIADTRAIIGVSSIGANNFNLRTANTVAYISPSLAGFTFIGAAVADPTDNSSSASNNSNGALSGSLTWATGPFYVAAAYEKHFARNEGGLDSPEPSGYRIGGSWKFLDTFKIGGLFEDFDGDDKGNGLSSNVNAQAIDRKAWSLFGTWDFGNNTLKLAYTGADSASLDGGEDFDFDNVDSKAYMVSLGLDHKFSKRTKAYLVGVVLDNKDEGSKYRLNGGHNTDTFKDADFSEKQYAVSLGMMHNF